MKTSITLSAVTAAALSLASCTSSPSGGSASAPKPTAAPVAQAKPKPAKPAVKPYPLDLCIVSDEGLESMGGSITKVYNGQQVKFCCKGCVKEFEADPASFLSKLP